jgi:glycosyltransferase involved in cell wall biosynthesis
MAKIVLFANTDWYLFNFRLSYALKLKSIGHDVFMVSPGGRYAEEFRAHAITWIPIHFDRRGLNPLSQLRAVLRLFFLLRKIRPELLHAYTLKCAVFGGIAGRMAKVPSRVSSLTGMGYVFSSRDLLAMLLRPIVKRVLKALLSGRGSRVIVQNTDDFAALIREGIVSAGAIRLVRGSGVDPAKFGPADLNGSDRIRVLFVGRLLEDKGIREFVEAAEILRDSYPAIEMMAAGDVDPGNPSSIPIQQLKQWSQRGDVEFLGHVKDVAQLLRTVQIVSLPSYREGLPRVLLEAGASGLAVVATNVPGCRELVVDGVDGVLVGPRDGAALAKAIEGLALSPELRARYGEALRAKVSKEYSDDVIAERTIAVYSECLVQDGSARD